MDFASLLVDRQWIMIQPDSEKKVVFVFRSRNHELIVSTNGIVVRGSWEMMNDDSLLIDYVDTTLMLRHGFIQDDVLALKRDGMEDYALFISEKYYLQSLQAFEALMAHLESVYLKPRVDEVNKPPRIPVSQAPAVPVTLETKHPDLTEKLEMLKNELLRDGCLNSTCLKAIVSFTRDHSLEEEVLLGYPEFCSRLESGTYSTGIISYIFADRDIKLEEKEALIQRLRVLEN